MTYEETLGELALADGRVVVMTAENRAPIRRLPAVLGPRFLDAGIAEQALVGAAAGLALRGRIPVVHALAAFLTMRAFEFVRTDVGIARLPVKLVGGVPGLLSEANGPTHQALEDVALMRGIPGMGVFCPADEEELVAGLPSVLAEPGPWYVRFNARPAHAPHVVPFVPGRAEELWNSGTDVVLLAYGTLVSESLDAARNLSFKGVGTRLLNLRTLVPLDRAAVLDAASSCRLLVTVEDHFVPGGLFSLVAETLVEGGVRCACLPIGLRGRWFRPALFADALQVEGLTGEAIAFRVLDGLEKGAAERGPGGVP